MIKSVEKAYGDFLQAQEIERRESHSSYYSRGSDLIFSISSVWQFMREISVNPAFRDRWMCSQGVFDGLKDNSAIQQESLLRLITFFVQDENIDKIKSTGKGQFWYLFANAVASFSNYNNMYWVSSEALETLHSHGINGTSPVTRNKIFQIRDQGKKLLIFEHMCPATQLIKLILKQKDLIKNTHNKWSRLTLDNSIKIMVQELLHDYGLVAIVTKEEDQKLRGELRNELDLSWPEALSQMMHRYSSAGIRLEQHLVPVYGKMYR